MSEEQPKTAEPEIPPKPRGTNWRDITQPYVEQPKIRFPDVSFQIELGGLEIHAADATNYPTGIFQLDRQDDETLEAFVKRVQGIVGEVLLKWLPVAEDHRKKAAEREEALAKVSLEEMFRYTPRDHADFLREHPECAQG